MCIRWILGRSAPVSHISHIPQPCRWIQWNYIYYCSCIYALLWCHCHWDTVDSFFRSFYCCSSVAKQSPRFDAMSSSDAIKWNESTGRLFSFFLYCVLVNFTYSWQIEMAYVLVKDDGKLHFFLFYYNSVAQISEEITAAQHKLANVIWLRCIFHIVRADFVTANRFVFILYAFSPARQLMNALLPPCTQSTHCCRIPSGCTETETKLFHSFIFVSVAVAGVAGDQFASHRAQMNSTPQKNIEYGFLQS